MSDPPGDDSASPLIIANDTPCRRCGYNLRGLSTDGQCPECGTLVSLSLVRDLLEHSDPTWLQTLRRGMHWMLWSLAAVILYYVGIVVGRSAGMRIPSQMLPMMAAVAGGINAWGRYLLTIPDPSGLGESQYGSSRRIVRITIATNLAGVVLSFAPKRAPFPADLLIVVSLLQAAIQLCYVVGFFAQMQYFQKLMLRIPDYALSKTARFLKLAMGISLGVVIAAMVVSMLARQLAFNGRSFRTTVGCVGMLAGLPLLIFVLMYVGFLVKAAARFGELSRVSALTWAAGNRAV